LFTIDRRLAFHLDSENQGSYRNEQSSENTMPCPLGATSCPISPGRILPLIQHFRGHFDTHGETSSVLVRSLAAIDVSGNYNASSTSDFLRESSEHASSSNHCAEMGSRAASSLSIGEVQTRTHTHTQGSEESFRVVIS